MGRQSRRRVACPVAGCPSGGERQDVVRVDELGDVHQSVAVWLECGHYVASALPPHATRAPLRGVMDGVS